MNAPRFTGIRDNCHRRTGREGGAREAAGAAAPPPNFGQLRFFGKQEKNLGKASF